MTEQPRSTGEQTGSGRLVAGHTESGAGFGEDGHDDNGHSHRAGARSDSRTQPRMTEHPTSTTERTERTTVIARGSRLRGGPVLGGFVIGFATWILLELALFALDLGALAAQVVPNSDASTWWWSGVAAMIGFFVGGLVAGASLPYRRVDDGILNGIAMWAVTVVSLIVMSAIGAGIGFGVIGDLLATSSTLANADASTVNDAQSAAGGALLALSVTLAAAAVGGALGSKLWPSGEDRHSSIDLRR